MKKYCTNILVGGLVVFVILFLWQCPFERITGIPCPGCMMTTALYYLIQFDFKSAFYFNPVIYLLVVMGIPLLYTYKRNRNLFSKLLTITLILWFLIYIYRMITIFPEFPMSYVEDNVISNMIDLLK